MRFTLDSVCSGRFLTPARLRLWCMALLMAYAAAIVFLCLTAHGLNDAQGRPLGSDFSNVYAAGVEANAGHAAWAFDPAKHIATEKAIFGAKTPFYGWHYPPFFLLIAAPLAHMSYLPALLVWQVASFALYLGGIWLLLRKSAAHGIAHRWTWLLPAVAFPAVFANLLAGHNGFLTAAILAGALACLNSNVIISGVLFGLLAYKPQFAILIPLVLIATQRWRTLISAAATTATLAAFCTLLFGPEIWHAFFAFAPFTQRVVLEQGNAGFYKIESVFAWVRMWGGSVSLAYALQSGITLTVAAALVWLWRGQASREIKGATLCIAAIVATPYSLDYDLMALAPAIALLAAQGLSRGFKPFEKSALAALWLAPLFARALPALTSIPVAAPVLLATLALLLLNGLTADDAASTHKALAPSV